ncbi:dihydroxyacetone kinase subunit DhaL [Kineococcus terrestris]|uniref:dihydroxyacetone kinase subunit DhaL n=1 Tax=Kineococcus terrestris TaxID=2044856 RepID=UPI0035A05E49
MGPVSAVGGTALDADAARAWVRRFAELVQESAVELTDLDRPIGDSDHGVNLRRGAVAVLAALDGPDAPATAADVLRAAGTTLVSTVGGASGPLYGTALRRVGKALVGVDAAGGPELARALRAGVDAVVRLGGAEVGDATMVDALLPAVEALEREVAAGTALPEAVGAAVRAAQEGAESTDALVARKGRASYLGERSAGHRDPGAVSSVLLLRALADALGGPA